MKKLSTLVGVAFFALMIVGCEGPQGVAGQDGAAGADGADGADGINAAETCTDCHTDDTEIFAAQVQYAVSTHRTGGNFERGGNTYEHVDNECAVCHSHEGFTEFLASGTTVFTPAFDDPTPPNCRTCHNIHTSYTQADWGLTTEASFDLVIDGSTIDLGKGNLCANCHQPLQPDPMPDISGSGTGITFTSPYWGPHYGAQGAMLAGEAAFVFGNVSGPATGPNTHGNVSANAGGCVTCHMADAFGDQAGGHTWNMTYMYHGGVTDLIAGCETSGCHSTITDFDHNGVQTAIQLKIDALKALLIAAGIMDASDHAVPGAVTDEQAAALVNYLLALKDHSVGVHNPAYLSDMLDDTILELGGTIP